MFFVIPKKVIYFEFLYTWFNFVPVFLLHPVYVENERFNNHNCFVISQVGHISVKAYESK